MVSTMSEDINIRLSSSSWNKVVENSFDREVLEDVLDKEVVKDNCLEMSLAKMIKVAKRKRDDGTGSRLNRVLHGAQLFFPEVVLPVRSPEFKARLARLQAQQDQREYDEMVANVSRRSPASSGGYRAPVASGLSFAVTVFASIIGALFLLSDLVPDVLLRCAVGFTVGIVLMCIEVFLALRAIVREEEENAKTE